MRLATDRYDGSHEEAIESADPRLAAPLMLHIGLMRGCALTHIGGCAIPCHSGCDDRCWTAIAGPAAKRDRAAILEPRLSWQPCARSRDPPPCRSGSECPRKCATSRLPVPMPDNARLHREISRRARRLPPTK